MSENQRIDEALQELTNEETADSLKDLTKEAATLKNEIDELGNMADAKAKRLKEVSDIILRTLDLMELDNIRAHGFLFFKENKTSVTTPKTLEDKKALFDYLVEQGIFLEIASVNSQTLNSLYKDKSKEAAIAGDLDFKLPGVAEPTTYINLKLRRG